MKNNTIEIVGQIVHHYKYIKFPDNILLKNVKILKAKARDSFWYLKYPYILELTYAKEWEQVSVVYTRYGPITTYHHHKTKDYTFKYESVDDIATKIREMRDAQIVVENDIKPSSKCQ